MARYKHYDLNQTKMIPLSYADQVVQVRSNLLSTRSSRSIWTCRCSSTATTNLQPRALPVESSTGVQGGACAHPSSEFFYGLVGYLQAELDTPSERPRDTVSQSERFLRSQVADRYFLAGLVL